MTPRRLSKALLPDELGRDFPWIWSGWTIANLGDGVLLAAGPLLVASITSEPFAVAMALFVQRVPWFLFGLFAGAIVDRVDRRLLVIWVDVFRAGVLAVLAAAVSFDVHNLPLIYIAMFLLGTAETIADNAGSALVAGVVPKAGLGPANARLIGSMMVTNQLAGPPLGAFIFIAAAWTPFGFNSACFVIAAALISRTRVLPRERASEPSSSVRRDVIEGLKWLWAHAAVRTLTIMIAAFNITFGAAFSIYVLYATEHLGLSELGFGVLMAVSAVGGVAGSMIFSRLERRFDYAFLFRGGLIFETFTHLALALAVSAYVAGAVMFVFGAHAVVWGTTATTVRQKAVPEGLLGRVTSVYLIGCFGALALGSLLGGALAQRWGVLAPFWFAFAGSALILLLTWKAIGHVTQAVGGSDDGPPSVAPRSRIDVPVPERG